ncbi:ABC transporter ATP-binding protein [Halalkalibacter akibai]|uniref:Lipid A export ATP-binding/permease protein MsbA n=1 Tax=Halalkalibacter akibai (strain ATCC 43226 / DSM 21942 / CIP 109018 / JCM 9157 / 1139) TaxID=1236973 RepID=W4QZB0_HALA3|nr:ABC transporter ATP-binding protein [Halalkalibacter akibai]GAE37003.1 lipid A export ATP-binding/permease protein MsbA [Halalkalibacter akibai JCM 9157]
MKLFSFLKPYKFPIVIALFLMFVELVVELLHPLLLAKIIDDGIMQEDMSVILNWGAIMVGMSLLAFLAGVVNSFYAAHVSQSTGYDIRSELYEKIQTFTYTKLQRFQTSSLITRMTNDVSQIQNTIFMSLRIMLRAPLLVIGGTIMALLVNVQLALILVITIPILICFLIWMMKKGGALFSQVQAKLDGVNHVMRENLVAMRLVKVFVRHRFEESRFNKSNDDLVKTTVSALRLMEIAMPVLLLLMNVSVMAILWFGSFAVNTGGTQVGEVVAIINYATRITSALTVISMIVIVFSRARASAERITDVLETNVDAEKSTKAIEIKDGSLEFKEVSFQYPSTDIEVLKRINFKVEGGKTLAILGSTGSGKTTLFQLIPNLYEVTSGEIYIGGHPVHSLDLDEYRKKIGYVPQDVFLFSGTIKENLQWGKQDATMEEIVEAAKDAQIHDVISQLPDQYETKIGQKGVNLSGGQKQRLSIARALVRKPIILLLDDSTSALDVKTEALLLQALKRYNCTTCIITQKISTAKKADQIILLDEGMIVDEGSHEILIKQSSLYQKINESQLREEELQDV